MSKHENKFASIMFRSNRAGNIMYMCMWCTKNRAFMILKYKKNCNLFVQEHSFSLTVCSCHVMYTFQSEPTLYSCLNVKELLAQNRWKIWILSDLVVVHSSPVTLLFICLLCDVCKKIVNIFYCPYAHT